MAREDQRITNRLHGLMTKIMQLIAYHHFLTIYLIPLKLFIILYPLLAAAQVINTNDLAALLSFKSQIYADPLGVFSSWNDSTHYCRWQGVQCGRHHPDRVTGLTLDSKQLSGYISPSLANLTFLRNISLSKNNLIGSIPSELGYLGRLQYIDLGKNFLDGTIPSTLANCSKLQVISLRSNHLHGTIPSNLAQCKQLLVIYLAYNFLTGGIPPEFGHIPNLQTLGLYGTNLTGSIPSTLGNLSSLNYLYLHQNNLGGCIPDSLGKLGNLSELWLYGNNFSGSIPLTFGNLIKLSYLYLEQNSLSGHIPYSLGNLTNLLQLTLYQNRLTGTIPSSLSTLNNLRVLHLYQNRLSGFIPSELGSLQNLQSFNIYGNNISGQIPHSLYNISAMVDLELGNNLLQGTLIFGMCDAFPNLQNLYLFENQLNGHIPPSISNCSALTDVELRSNYFSGTIPSTIGKLKNLSTFSVGYNQLEAEKSTDWSFIDSLTNCTYLQLLGFGSNQLRGAIPSSITNLSINLFELSISHNPIHGTIPIELEKLTNLTNLEFSHMLLSGTLSERIGNLFNLEHLDMSNNMIYGQIPSTFGNFTKMTQLFLNDNAFEGSIPPELINMHVLELLNLSNNRMTGKIPKEIMGISTLSISLDLSHNNLTDILPPEIGNLKNLQTIRLSNNRLFGELPSTIGGCQELQALYLENNLFQGTIPSTLSNLRGLQVLDISNNFFFGAIPEFMGKMNLSYLNISFNNFEGELPTEGIFKKISGLDVRGNPKLCGGVHELHLPQCISKPQPRHHPPKHILLISVIIGSFIFLAIVVCIVVSCYSRKRHHDNLQPNRAIKYKMKPVSYNDLLRATENFSSSNLIGMGTFGKVYKAIMDFENTKTIAVKVLNLEKNGASRSFFSECRALRNVRHRNLIKVLSSCSSIDHHGNDFKALVFEYMPNGNLASWLHPNSYNNPTVGNLNLSQRMNIAIDVAAALDYLHSHVPVPIVHCDLKPNNILLDNDMIAHVSDFGLAKFLVQPNSFLSQSMTSTSGIKGSIGYIPPEYGMGIHPSAQGDLYSYGILLLEMFTGVSPTDEKFGDGLSLHKHVVMNFPHNVMDIIDSKLFSQFNGEENPYAPENVYDCLIVVFQCGILCSKESPKERICIKDVLKELHSARNKLVRL